MLLDTVSTGGCRSILLDTIPCFKMRSHTCGNVQSQRPTFNPAGLDRSGRTSLHVRTTMRAHIAIFVAVATTSVEHEQNNCDMNRQNILKKIIRCLLLGGICLISLAIMAFLLWIHASGGPG